ncbi:ABC transporter substrate-binding protein [Salinarimonas soli]|uniref:ABC transporter substrate-binding protein n=1 Tax=Salinarimonas soli TaxID=1638099 RepID=A0A5B2VF76_9HYPH|nr:ABC transporter substrate-binding protein [Salinarimonas soli]KAA2237515.1 ABC transporter substrate-binding protein [Salinarimonas soli]
MVYRHRCDPLWKTLVLAALVAAGAIFLQPRAASAQAADIRIALIARKPPPPPLYDFDAPPEDDGVAGGRMAVADNNTTGRFTGHRFALDERELAEGEDAAAAARTLADEGVSHLVLALNADETLAVADALKGRPVTLFNAAAPDDRLRGEDCRAGLLHVAPSRAMQTDALAQFLAFKRWRRIFIVVGPQPGDRLYADAMRRSAKKFGLQVAAEKPWEFGPLARTKGDSPTTADALVFTRGVDYDVAVVADEAGDWGDYLAYRTWDPRLVAGTQGLTPTTWHPTLEVWGAAQAQNRFRRMANRPMRPLDHQVWIAVRSIGEAVTRTKSTDPAAIAAFLRSPDFAIPAYKGVPLSFRPWDNQLRQPILIAQARSLVSVAPERGFLHQRTPLDTLGFDEGESACKAR